MLVDLLLVLPGISSHSRSYKKLPFAILWGIDLPLDLPGIMFSQ